MKVDTVHMMPTAHVVSKLGMVCIFGTGDFGRSLGLRLLQSGYGVVYGSRNPQNSSMLPQGSKVMTHAEAAQVARVIFVTVQREHYDFLTSLTPALKGKVLVDVSNNLKKGQYPESNAEHLSRLVPGVAVVKGFNTVSAWALQSGALDSCKQVFICGDHAGAKQAVIDIAQSLGLTPVDRGSLRAAGELEDIPLELFPDWRLPLCIALVLTTFFFFYLLIRDVIYTRATTGKDTSYRIVISIANMVVPIVSLIMLSLCYLPSILAAILQLYNGTKYRRFPNWLDRWMLCRKQMGLVSLAFACWHVLYCFGIAIRYYVTFYRHEALLSQVRQNATSVFDVTRSLGTDMCFTLGVMGFCAYLLVGISSIPSVGSTLNWREFRFIQSKLGHLTLVLCTAHGLMYGWDRFLRPAAYVWWTPPAHMLCLVLPCVVLVSKLILITPCLDRPLTRIRQGWERHTSHA